jgi:hypothetical protein
MILNAMSLSAVQYAAPTVGEPEPPFHHAEHAKRGLKNILIQITGPAQQLAHAHHMGPPKSYSNFCALV